MPLEKMLCEKRIIIEESIDFKLIAQEHVHGNYCVSSVGLHGVAALYDNLGSKFGTNSRRKK